MVIVINQNIPSIPAHVEQIRHYGNFYHHVLIALGYPVDSPPLGELLRRYHGLSGEWLIASPIHWEATHNDAMIVACGDALGIDEQQSRELFHALMVFMKDEHMTMYYHDTSTWLIQVLNQPKIHALSPHTLLHQSMFTHLTRLDETRYWQKYITEIQMFLSMHPLNQGSQIACTVNGVWLWGGGALHVPTDRPVVCDANVFRLAEIVSHPVVLDKNLSLIDPPKDCILLLEQLSQSEQNALEQRFKHRAVTWYWNNMAYRTQPKHWMIRLKENLLKCL